MPWDYSDKVRQLFMDAVAGKAGTHMGEIPDADGVGRHGSIACGDAMEFMFRVEKDADDPHRDRIVESRYRTFGCTSAIASSEALCRLLEERRLTPVEALAIKNADIVDYLDGLPPQKLHCSVMGAEALQAAVVDWARRRGVPSADLGIDPALLEEDEGRIVCRCFNLTEPYIRRKIKELGLSTIDDVTAAIKAGGACTACHHEPGGIQDLLDETWGGRPEPAPARPAAEAQKKAHRTPYQLAKEIERVLEQVVRPRLAADGGDLEIVDIRDRKVFCRLQGVCAGCAGARQTLRFVVEDALREAVDPEITVIEV
ncbi:MAG: iron-sulfur cluster assembly scaffold protein [Deltaproteobacteria bacterium]|nr:iron-sulfur cluster assembly scaffold protein [Deltaproteobacteria bacterium]